jgi:hypothetical protein
MHCELNPESFGDALSWLGDTALAEQFDEAFTTECELALEKHVSPATTELLDLIGRAGRSRVLRSPEVTRQTLFAPTLPLEQIDSFIKGAAQVELALTGAGRRPMEARWSALGDVMITEDDAVRWWPRIAGANPIPLDFGSPWAQRVDLTGRLEFTTAPRQNLSDEQVHAIHGRLDQAIGLLEQLAPTLPKFVSVCTRVLVLQIDSSSAFVASGSNGRFVGRSFITNPQSADATTDCLVEAVVHEAIHAMIYCECLRRPWADGEAAIEVPRVESPWTGRALPVRPFLEAACVWFGLVHLWTLALSHDLFEREAAHNRLMRSLRGFCRGSLVDRARPWWPEIRPDVLATVDHLQSRILDAVGDAS